MDKFIYKNRVNFYIPKPLLSARRTMLQARSFLRKKIHVSGNEYYYIHIPAKLAHDSQFPFKDGDELRIAVDTFRSRMIVEKINSKASKKKLKNKK